MALIKAIELPASFDVYMNAGGKRISSLPVSNINIFVGSNNSGKSRFMRMLSAQAEYQALLNDLDLVKINSSLTEVIDQIIEALNYNGIDDANGTVNISALEMLKALPRSLSLKTDTYKRWRDTFTKWKDFPDITSWSSGRHNVSDGGRIRMRDAIRQRAADAIRILDQVPINSEFSTPKRVYIPVLRGLRPIDANHSDLYAERTYQDYFSSLETDVRPDVFTGLSFYQRLTNMLLGDNVERKIISKYQEFISETLFENRSIALIPSPKSKAVIVKIGNEKEQPIFHLGDGIQSAIILSFLPYIMQEPTFFFIEEPEIYLHPGLQRKIIDFFVSLGRHTFFLTTHSNHFLDLTIDVKNATVFTFRKHLLLDENGDEQIPTFTIESVDSGDRSSLELLGVRNSSVFLVNATIWVEGITDRWYIRAMLNAYMDHLAGLGSLPLRQEEDVHYSFVEYGGANITHWSFLDNEDHPIEVERLCARALVIVDEDGNTKLRRKEQLAKTLGERLIILPVREIENLLPYDVIRQVVLEYEGTPERELPNISYASYQDKYIGTFIESKVLQRNFTRRGGYRDDSGTIKSKVDFCKRALPNLKYETLPPTAKAVIEKIYQYILTLNT